MTLRPAKGILLALTDIERADFLRLRLYVHYDRDDELQAALIRYHRDWWDDLGPGLRRLDDCLPDLDDALGLLVDTIASRRVPDYFRALVALAEETGLGRIPAVGRPPVTAVGYLPSGLAQAHRFLWHLDKALLYEAAPPNPRLSAEPIPRPTFVGLNSFGPPVPAVDTAIRGSDARWDPRSETRAVARHRLRAETSLSSEQIEGELDRIAADGDYSFPDTPTERNGISRLERDAEWTWWRIRHRWTYRRIAEEWDRLHPRDVQLQVQQDRKLTREETREPWYMTNPTEAVGLVRKAVGTFARRARIRVDTGPGRRRG